MSPPQEPLPPLRGDGSPRLASGEPVLARWFVLAMLLLVPIAFGVTLWALSSTSGGQPVAAAERRPPGDGTITIDRGDAQFGEVIQTTQGPACGTSIELIGDSGTRAAASRALAAACQLLDTGAYPQARAGLGDWIRHDGLLRIAVFERSGVESSARLEDGRIILELNAKFLFEDAARAAPTLLHQLVLIGQPSWPGQPITAATELAAAQVQFDACGAVRYVGEEPRGCRDVAELLEDPDALAAIVEAGFPAGPDG